MVQRKADTTCNKPSLNNLKSSSSLSSSLHQNHLKNSVKKPDLKKKIMKRSVAIIKGDSTTPQRQLNDLLTPNYMKSTSSSMAKKERSAEVVRTSSLRTRTLRKNPSFKSTVIKKQRCSSSKVVALCESMKMDDVVQKPTCSSTLKHRRFPAYLELSHGGTESSGTSVFKVCPYTYCSLNGHYDEPLPPLKLFLSAKRRAMKKAQKGPKLDESDELKEEIELIQDDEVSSRIIDVITKGESMDCFKETETDDQEEASDMELEMNVISDIYNNVEYEYTSETEIVESEFKGIEYEQPHDRFDDVSQDSTYVDSDVFSCSSDQSDAAYDLESLGDVKGYESVEPEGEEDRKPALDLLEDQDSLGHLLKDDSLTSHIDQTSLESQVDSYEKEGNKIENCIALSLPNQEKEPKPDPKKPITDSTDQPGDFSLRGPNFLPLEPDPDAEKVDLKHQEVDERRNSEEFMVDYALRQVVTKLAPARKRKVELLVEAFEKVMPESKCEIHSRQSTRFDDHARAVQACN